MLCRIKFLSTNGKPWIWLISIMCCSHLPRGISYVQILATTAKLLYICSSVYYIPSTSDKNLGSQFASCNTQVAACITAPVKKSALLQRWSKVFVFLLNLNSPQFIINSMHRGKNTDISLEWTCCIFTNLLSNYTAQINVDSLRCC